MKCPVCDDMRMKEVEKEGVLIDICPQCKGVWLDRGELEKLLQGVKEVQADYERLEREAHDFAGHADPHEAGAGGGFAGQPPQGPPPGGQAAYGQGGQGGFGAPDAGRPAPGYGQPAGFGPQGGQGQPGAYGQPGPYGQQPGSYGQPHGQQGSYGHGYGKYGYDKYGRPYKKKKTVLDVFGDLFD